MYIAVLVASLWFSADARAEKAILAIRAAHDAAYNRHDAKALAELFAPDGDRVSNAGVYSIGRAAIEKAYADVFNGPSKNAHVETRSAKIRFLTGDVAILDVDSLITGRVGGDVVNHATTIYVKRNGAWELVAERTTRVP